MSMVNGPRAVPGAHGPRTWPRQPRLVVLVQVHIHLLGLRGRQQAAHHLPLLTPRHIRLCTAPVGTGPLLEPAANGTRSSPLGPCG
jgi:hypothetical protein